jgi:hypothetical protein
MHGSLAANDYGVRSEPHWQSSGIAGGNGEKAAGALEE